MPTEEQLQEIHRLAVLGEAAEIAQEVGPRLTRSWLATSRFREAREVSLQTLALGPHARTLNDLAHAKDVLSERQESLKHYTMALSLYLCRRKQGGHALRMPCNAYRESASSPRSPPDGQAGYMG